MTENFLSWVLLNMMIPNHDIIFRILECYNLWEIARQIQYIQKRSI